ncbi:MAG: type II toxin-antitoxin system VapC family toxin [Geminicoccaceae bacterium]
MSMVVDASIVGCWCFPDESSAVADAALSAIATEEVVVPAVWWFEVRNLLLIGERHDRMDPTGTAAFLADLETMSIGIDHAPVSETVLALARTHRLTVYDAAYLELARRLGAPLATLDRKLAVAARAAGVALVGA